MSLRIKALAVAAAAVLASSAGVAATWTAASAHADTFLFSATTQISNDGATAGFGTQYGIWAFDGQNTLGGSDPFTRTLDVSLAPASTCNAQFSVVLTGTQTCYTATITDSGPFRTVVNANQPNQGTTNTPFASGDKISHTVAGTFTGSSSYVFYAPSATPVNATYVAPTLDDANVADVVNPTAGNQTHQWYLQAFPGHTGVTQGIQLNNWTWTYNTGCETWTDAFGDGNHVTGIDSYGESTPLSTFGEITGTVCPAPSPSPTPTSTGTPPPPPVSSYGDEVNPYGNGLDVFRQHAAWGTKIVGWPATKADPATHFLREAEDGNWRFEYAPNGFGDGLCVSNPGDNLLVLRNCNANIWQKFSVSGQFLISAVNGGIVVPDGTGAQLSVSFTHSPWGGDKYHWVPFSSLP